MQTASRCAQRYATRPGQVLSVDALETECLITVLLRSGQRLLAPAGGAGWRIGQRVEVLIETHVFPVAMGLAVRPVDEV